jgi:hypothetical protein
VQAKCNHCLEIFAADRENGRTACHRHLQVCKERIRMNQMVQSIGSDSLSNMSLDAMALCWGCPKIRMRSPNTRERKMSTFKSTDDAAGDKESPKDCSSLKSCESFSTCPRAPFYRETKGLLHSESTLESKEYS